MGEAATTVFTLLLFVSAFVGSGAYAVLSMADFRAARRGFWATAFSFAAIGLVLGVMTTWPLPVRIIVCAIFFGAAAGGLIWALDYLKVRERLSIETPPPPFPYIDTLRTDGQPLAERDLTLLIRNAPSITNVEVLVFLKSGVPATRFFYPIVYQRGEILFTDPTHTLRVGEGEYHISINDINGSYWEILKIRKEQDALKQTLTVYRSNKEDEGKSAPILYFEKEP